MRAASEVAQLKPNADWAAAEKPGADTLSGLARAFFYAEAMRSNRQYEGMHGGYDHAAREGSLKHVISTTGGCPKMPRRLPS
jgi:hypothetical protein